MYFFSFEEKTSSLVSRVRCLPLLRLKLRFQSCYIVSKIDLFFLTRCSHSVFVLADTTGHVYAQQFIFYAAFHSIFHWVPPDFKFSVFQQESAPASYPSQCTQSIIAANKISSASESSASRYWQCCCRSAPYSQLVTVLISLLVSVSKSSLSSAAPKVPIRQDYFSELQPKKCFILLIIISVLSKIAVLNFQQQKLGLCTHSPLVDGCLSPPWGPTLQQHRRARVTGQEAAGECRGAPKLHTVPS